MLKITNDNYLFYKQIAEVIWKLISEKNPYAIPEEADPVNILNKSERESQAKARTGLRLMLDDLFSMLDDAGLEEMAELDAELRKAKLPSLSELLAEVKQVSAKVLKRGKIRNEREWYVVTELLGRIDAPVSGDDREKLGQLCLEFEIKKKKP
ncbi:MAG: hypothetical protein JNM19_07135 [Chitinophagaceae bacterium]|nr:hypothetical protein [Chitinophagaceae bacterium]